MSFTTAWLWTLCRSLLLVGMALPWCGYLVRWIRTSPPSRRHWQLGLLALPVLFPELLTGYAYSQMTRLLITGWWTREAWFDLLLLLRVIPIGTWLWYCSPPSPLSREAIHVRRLALRSTTPLWIRWGTLSWYWLQGPARSGLFAACGLFLVLFQEFELASLLATTSWTVWLFDAQAGGLLLSESLRCCVPPAICTWLVCGLLPWLFCKSSLRTADRVSEGPAMSTAAQSAAWGYIALALGLIVIYPSLLLGRDLVPGLLALSRNSIQARGLLQGILVSAGNGLIAGFTVDLFAGWLVGQAASAGGRWRDHPWLRLVVIVSGVGLCGSLVLGLVGVALCQQPGLHIFSDTSLPPVVGLFVWLLPRALLLQGMLLVSRSPVAEHAAHLLLAAPDSRRTAAAHEILWHLRGRGATLVRLLLCHWAYWDLTLPRMLNPTGMEPATVRLYIDMHFGRNAMLTAKAGLTFLVPLIFVAVFWPWIRRNWTS